MLDPPHHDGLSGHDRISGDLRAGYRADRALRQSAFEVHWLRKSFIDIINREGERTSTFSPFFNSPQFLKRSEDKS